MAALSIKKVVALPETPEANTMYLVIAGGGYDTWITTSDGMGAYKQNGSSGSGTGTTSAEAEFHPFLTMGVGNG